MPRPALNSALAHKPRSRRMCCPVRRLRRGCGPCSRELMPPRCASPRLDDELEEAVEVLPDCSSPARSPRARTECEPTGRAADRSSWHRNPGVQGCTRRFPCAFALASEGDHARASSDVRAPWRAAPMRMSTERPWRVEGQAAWGGHCCWCWCSCIVRHADPSMWVWWSWHPAPTRASYRGQPGPC